MTLLAGDIGGTKTLLALFEKNGDPRHPVAEAEFHSADFATLDLMVRKFLDQQGRSADHACFDVAGPVFGGHAHLTNLPWELDEGALRQSLGMRRVMLLNDLQAIAHAVPSLKDDEHRELNAGKANPHAPIAVVAPGTGLGEAFLIWQGDHYTACASEGGHASFAPTDDRQIGLLRSLAARYGHVSVERVCSGPGIANIYDYLRAAEPGREPPAFAAALAAAADRTPLIAQAALEDAAGTTLAGEAVDLFIAILASECANMALKVMATGGVYLAGGIPAHILPKLTRAHFVQAFVGKGRLGKLLSEVPIHVVTARAALLGAALYGLEQM
jgi:glucokinase